MSDNAYEICGADLCPEYVRLKKELSDLKAQQEAEAIVHDSVRQERDELRAHCAVFRSLYDNFGNNGFEDAKLIEAFGNQALMLPAQSLAAIKAETVKEALDHLAKSQSEATSHIEWSQEYGYEIAINWLSEYADNLRKEAES